MKPATLLAVLASFVAGALVALAASDAVARAAPPAAPSAYSNASYGFSIVPPAFPLVEKGMGAQAAMFFAPVKDGFSGNLGVMVQNVKMSLDEYVKLSTGQFKQADFKVTTDVRKKVSGRDAAFWEYEGSPQGRDLKWMALAVVDGERIFLITGTSTAGEYEALSKEFKASIDSFKLTD